MSIYMYQLEQVDYMSILIKLQITEVQHIILMF